MPNVRVFPAQNGMLSGAVTLPINGTTQIVPLVGLPNLLTIAGILGDYNCVEGVCADSTRSSCGVSYGTFHVGSGGTWASCTQADYTADPTNCNGQPKSNGTLNYLGKGRWQILSGGVRIGTTMGFQAPNGQKVWLIDPSQPTAKGGFGVGLVAGSIRTSITTNTTTGSWLYAGLGYLGTLTVSGKSYTGQNFGGSSYSDSMTLNSPWAGLVTSSNGADALLAGTGVYAAANTSPNPPRDGVTVSMNSARQAPRRCVVLMFRRVSNFASATAVSGSGRSGDIALAGPGCRCHRSGAGHGNSCRPRPSRRVHPKRYPTLTGLHPRPVTA